MTTPRPASSVPTVRQAIDLYLQEKQEALSPDKLQVVGAALAALLQPALDELIDTLTPFRLVVLGGTLKASVSPKTGRPLASSTFRRYVLAGQEFWSWCSTRWPRAAKQPGAPAAEGGPSAPAAEGEPGSKQHLGELIRLLRTDAGLTRDQLGEGTKIGAIALKRIETRRRLPTRRELDLLLAAPAMQGLIEWAAREGVPVELAPGTGSDEEVGS